MSPPEPAAPSAPVDCTILGPTAHVTLMRPAQANALDAASITALRRTFAQMPQHVRVVVLSGAGRHFCAGADLGDMQRSVHASAAQNHADVEALSDLFAAVHSAPQVVIGRVHGAARGGGAGLVACCDLVVATADASFGFTEARLGLVPAVIAPHVVRRIGLHNAKRLFLTAELIDAQSALAAGLVDTVADAEQPQAIEPIVDSWQRAILRNGPKAISRIKTLLRELAELDEPAGQSLCIDTLKEVRISDEGQAGLMAFLQKRPPPWAIL